MELKGILIDFGYTIAYVDEEEDIKYKKRLVSILKKYDSDRRLTELSQLLDDAYRNNRTGETVNMEEFWGSFLQNMNVPVVPSLIRELEKCRISQLDKSIKLYNGVTHVLAYLKKRYKLALVSNCATGLSDVLEKLGLKQYFNHMILSYEVKTRKPEKQIYLEALRRIKLAPEQCIFIADEISDLKGARDVGLKTFLVIQGPNITHEAKDPNFIPDFKCNNISEIIKFL